MENSITDQNKPQVAQDKKTLEAEIVKMLKTCFDPEIPVDIYELGLIYDIIIDDENNVHIRMTLTSPACPVAGTLLLEVEAKVRTVPGVKDVRVELVWDPPWDISRMSEIARMELGFL